MLASLVVLAALGSTNAASSAVPWLEFQPTPAKATSASLLNEVSPTPAIFDVVLMGDIRIALSNEMTRFANEILPREGSANLAGSGYGDDVGGLVLLCGILGFFPGFGIGHLVAGNINGFILFLLVDIVIAAVFFVVFPAALWFEFWYVPGLLVFLVERIIEAFLAADSAARYRGYHTYRYGESDGLPAGAPSEHLPQAKPAFTILNF